MAGEQQGAQTLEKSQREVRLCKSVRTAVGVHRESLQC